MISALRAAIEKIPTREERLGGQTFKYVKLSEILDLLDTFRSSNADETTDVRIKNLTRALYAKQAKIDALMLEFCPGEISAEQKAEWAEHQQRSPEEPTDPKPTPPWDNPLLAPYMTLGEASRKYEEAKYGEELSAWKKRHPEKAGDKHD